MNDLRLRRLTTDWDRVRALVRANPDRIAILDARGSPPDQYKIEYRCISVVSLSRGRPQFGDVHHVRIELPRDYPLAAPPRATVVTSIRHPHVFTGSQAVCIGSRMVSEFLDSFVVRLYNILRYDPDYLDPNSPADADAMRWALRHDRLFPLDRRALTLPGQPAPEQPAILWQDRT